MHQPTDRKSKLYIYFFLLFFLTTFNNLSLINSESLKLKVVQIKVSGLSDENKEYLKTKSSRMGHLIDVE